MHACMHTQQFFCLLFALQLQYFQYRSDKIKDTFGRDIDFARLFKFKNPLLSEPVRKGFFLAANRTAVAEIIADSISIYKVNENVRLLLFRICFPICFT